MTSVTYIEVRCIRISNVYPTQVYSICKRIMYGILKCVAYAHV